MCMLIDIGEGGIRQNDITIAELKRAAEST